jgi:Tfp pilus assembly protein PilE
LTELLVVVAVLAILAAIGISVITGTVESSKANTAGANLEILNRAVRHYSQAVRELTVAPMDGISDETEVVAELKIDGSVDSRPGSPYLQPTLKITPSNDSSRYRASWNGYEFQLIEPGKNGIGIDLLDMQ